MIDELDIEYIYLVNKSYVINAQLMSVVVSKIAWLRVSKGHSTSVVSAKCIKKIFEYFVLFPKIRMVLSKGNESRDFFKV